MSLPPAAKGGAVKCVHSGAIRRFKSEVHRRPDRVTADEPEIVSAGCLHIDQLWRLERDLVAERRESRFEETAAGIHVADVDLNVMEHRASRLLDWSRPAPSERHVSCASVQECPLSKGWRAVVPGRAAEATRSRRSGLHDRSCRLCLPRSRRR